jgi:cytoskeleton protein RodZ
MTPPDAEITELPASPGARLRREREARGLTEQQAAETLTLDPSVILALEANDFPALGAPVFIKGHLRRYASLLGLPEDEILGSYERSKQQVDEPTLVPKSRLEMMPVRGRPKWPWVVGGAAAFLLAAGLAAYVSENGLPWANGADGTETASAGGPQSDAAANAALLEPPTTGADSPQVDARIGSEAPAGTAAAVEAPEAGPASARPPAAAGQVPAAAAAGAALAPGQVSLRLRFKGDSWVEIFDGSGKAVLYDLGKSGTERTLVATPPLSVTLGNAAAVTVAINGRAVTPPRTPGQVLARFSVAPDGTLR